MNYGYAPTSFDNQLEVELLKLVDRLGPDSYGLYASVERDGLYPGIRIRKLTNYSKDTVNWIVRKADAIYNRLESKEA